MSIAVLIQARIKPERVPAVLAALTRRIDPSPRLHTGRLRERIFQRLGSDDELLSLSQWESVEAFDTSSSTLNADLFCDALVAPMQVHRLVRLLAFERPMQRAQITAAALIVPTHGDSPAVRERVVQDRAELRAASGLISHEIYVTTSSPVMYLSIHSWRHLSDLERFRSTSGHVNERRLAEVGAMLERFTGALIAEYPVLSTRG